MKLKNTVAFDELDIKCLEELPLLVEVLSSTGNKLKQIFDPFVTDIYEQIQTLLPSSWEIDPKDGRNIFYPIVDPFSKGPATQLLSHFSLYNYYGCRHKERPRQDLFIVQFGFYYDASDEDYKKPCYYFQISRSLGKKQAPYHPLQFYQELQKNLSEYEIRIYHPDKGDQAEDITLSVFEHNVVAIKEGFTRFKEGILQPFFKNLPV